MNYQQIVGLVLQLMTIEMILNFDGYFFWSDYTVEAYNQKGRIIKSHFNVEKFVQDYSQNIESDLILIPNKEAGLIDENGFCELIYFYDNIFTELVWAMKAKPNKKRKEYTYLMGDKNNPGLYKIGISDKPNPIHRERTLAHTIPMIYVVDTAIGNIEDYLHEKFEKKRIRGEWFKLNDKDIRFILNTFKDAKNV